MISPISAYSPTSYAYFNPYRSGINAAARGQTAQTQNVPKTAGAPSTAGTAGAQSASQVGASVSAHRAAQPELPVQPVSAATPVNGGETQPVSLGIPIRQGADPAEMAVRMRIQYADPSADTAANSGVNTFVGATQNEGAKGLVNEQEKAVEDGNPIGAEAVQKAVEDSKCETCEQRKYQDGSDDMSVSFQTPTHIDPNVAASTVRGHEMEHVSHEQAKAEKNDRKVVSQNVTLHTDICPECGKVYVSGGTTRTVTAANPEQEAAQQQKDQQQQRTPFAAVA